jgi:hypothetical protein
MPKRSLRPIGFALASAAAAALVAHASSAGGDPRMQAARELFAQAEQDEDAGRWSDAIEKLRRVLEVKRTAGVQYHIALCEEHTGALVAALEDYTIAEQEAHEENAQDVLRLVGKTLGDLNPRVPRLTLRVVPDTVDAALTLDGKAIAHALWATALPVDPGEHRIEATAEGRESSAVTIVLNERDATILEVKLGPPRPIDAPAAPAGVSLPPEPPATVPASRTTAMFETAGFAALAGGGLAAFLGADAARTRAIQACAQRASPSPDACNSEKTAVRAWDWVAAGAWTGAAVVGALAVLAWTRPAQVRSAARPYVIAGPMQVGIGGDF